MFWKSVNPLIEQIEIESNPGNQPVTVRYLPDGLEEIGTGTDAVVVRHSSHPGVVFKRYAAGREKARLDEYTVYRRLGQSDYFPVCFGMEDHFLVLSYEKGPTLYDCLIEGIPIPENVIREVDEARDYVRSRGLNPRDIHLKNVLLQDGHVKLLDVSEYLKPGNDGRWDHLVQGYRLFYPWIEGRKIPISLIEQVKQAYYDQVEGDFSLIDFGRRFLQLWKGARRQPRDRSPEK
ncbi:hypothetical protein C8P63_12121 [Melghirimyces profundicolus]|uniref:Serine/threonine protein kinase n=1 Tax=Melghirimyces profundicolus TaxID=1242148 RepID=A0A2T6BGH4_9BACL|nr:serine/threonine protein kinase [Melghirimyces profundicolus]PTX55141.1 hypothetical protein C8P63_12121 [Melghirimyces profundicolus]